jgi:hypothetical protein
MTAPTAAAAVDGQRLAHAARSPYRQRRTPAASGASRERDSRDSTRLPQTLGEERFAAGLPTRVEGGSEAMPSGAIAIERILAPRSCPVDAASAAASPLPHPRDARAVQWVSDTPAWDEDQAPARARSEAVPLLDP